MRPLACSILVCCGLVVGVAWGQAAQGTNPLHSPGAPSERHLGDRDPAHVLFQRSAFAHGYIHGYEDGFHESNLDYQLNRGPRQLKEFEEFRKGDRDYSRSFGDKNSYKSGYRNGFVEGYQDGIRGGWFRAVRELREIAAGMNPMGDHATFNAAFAKGYQLARNKGFPPDGETACPGESAEYCEGFARGYRLGEADVGANGAGGVQTARVVERRK
jgi:hypothetical protein